MAINNKRNLTATVLLLGFTSILYWQLNNVGYLPPIDYWLKSKNNNDFIYLAATQADLINYERSLLDIVSAPINKFQTAILVEKSKYKLTLYYRDEPIKLRCKLIIILKLG